MKEEPVLILISGQFKRISQQDMDKFISISNKLIQSKKKNEQCNVYGRNFKISWNNTSNQIKNKLERKDKMSIQINTEKIIIGGKKYRRILLPLCGALGWQDVPLEYLQSKDPAFIWNESMVMNLTSNKEVILLLYCHDNSELLSLKQYPESEFQQILSYIRKAGDNLQKINQKLKLQKWKGQEKFVI